MSKWQEIKTVFQRHAGCIMIMLLGLLIGVIVLMGGEDKDLVSYLSFACALAGILLAVVVIFHTWIDSADTRTILTDFRSHLTVIQGSVGKTEDVVSQLAAGQNMLNQMDSKMDFLQQPTELTEGIPFRLSNIRIFTLLCLYCAVKSAQDGGRLFFIDDLIPQITLHAEIKDEPLKTMVLASMAAGTMSICDGLVSPDNLDLSNPKAAVRIKRMPIAIATSIDNELKRRIDEPPIDPQYKASLRRSKKGIDDYFRHS